MDSPVGARVLGPPGPGVRPTRYVVRPKGDAACRTAGDHTLRAYAHTLNANPSNLFSYGVEVMRPQALVVGTVIAAVCAVSACSTSTTSPGGGGAAGGNSNTITGSTTTTGGVYGSGGNYFWSPNPDTVAS